MMDFNLTDLGNAKRFVMQHCLDIKYVHGWGWLHWNGMYWEKDTTGVISRKAKETVMSLYRKILTCNDADSRKAFSQHATKSESETAIRHLIELAKTESDVVSKAGVFDLDSYLLNTSSGIIDLRTGVLREHERADMITRLAQVQYDPTAQAPTWLNFLDRIMDGNQEMIEFLQRTAGYILTATTVEQCLFLFYGLGANGKTVFINIFKKLLGEYAMTSPAETFMIKHDGGVPNDVARLAGARLVSVQETETGKRLAEALVKAVTGGDTITARFLHKEYFEFKPTFKLILSTNHKPRIQGRDHGIWRRVKLIPFSVSIPKGEQDPHLETKITAELSGVLNWGIEGCLKWQKEGLNIPNDVVVATEAYKDECADNISIFVKDYAQPGQAIRIGAKQFFDLYTNWCSGNGEEPLAQKAFKSRLQDLGLYQKRSGASGGLEWRGIVESTEGLKCPDANSDNFSMRTREKKTENCINGFQSSVNSNGAPILEGD